MNRGETALVQRNVLADEATKAVDDCAVCHCFRSIDVAIDLCHQVSKRIGECFD